MLGVCESCANELVEHCVMQCRGFCSARFCFRCASVDEALLESVGRCRQMYWMCHACSKMMENARFRNALISTNVANDLVIEKFKDDIRTEVLNEIRKELNSNFNKLIDAVPKTPIPPAGRNPFYFESNSKRGREEDRTPFRPAKLLRGNDRSAPGASDLNNQNSNNDKFWLYLSGISPKAPDDSVLGLVKERLETENVKIVKLVPRGRDLSSLNFVSFKVELPAHMKSRAMTTNTWPVGIVFREFEDKSRERRVFWQPPATVPNTDTVDITEVTAESTAQSSLVALV
nr:uncharacterized protein LOC109406348 [Aedes albopictus]